MSTNTQSPQSALAVLRNLVAELERNGVEWLRVADMRKAIDEREGTK